MTKRKENEIYKGYEVRECLGHYHISTGGHDLIYGPFKTAEETKKAIDMMIEDDARKP